MIPLKESIRNEIAGSFGIAADELNYLASGREDNDGILYTYEKNQKKQVLKICAKETPREIERAKIKLEFAHFLGEKGINVSYPLVNADGEVVQTLASGKHQYIAYVMDYIEGSIRKTEELDSNMVREWGKITGKLHAVTKSYHDWKSIPGGDYSWGIEEEMDGFYRMCRNEIVKEKWLDMRKELNSWEKDRDTYGFTHNDNHQNNILVNGNELTLIDFDCAECTFLLQDLFIPIQGILFDQTGGFNQPITDMDTIKKFYESFLAGYETENHMEDKWLARLETLLNYRRLLLFTVMQDWMEADEKIRMSFLEMIQNPCSFSIL